jgi:hypothetical protein
MTEDEDQVAGVLEGVRAMTLRPSDVLVFRTNVRLTQAREKSIREHLQEVTDHGRILILDSAADVAVLRPEAPTWWTRVKEALRG